MDRPNPHLLPGVNVRVGDHTGRITERMATRNNEGPIYQITVEYPDGRTATYVNDDINRIEAL